MNYLAISLLVLMLLSCSDKEAADLLVVNARVYTVDSLFTEASGFVVKDGKFLAVGKDSALREKYEADSVVDAGGKTVIPGLIDAHCHFYKLGLKQQQVNLTGTSSFREVLERVESFRKEQQPQVLFGKGWDQNDWEVKEFPDKRALDSLYPDTPVVLERIDAHAYLVNQKVLDMAGIDASTKAVGGEIHRKDGVLSGMLVDGPMQLVNAVLPGPSRETKIRALLDAQQICLDYGLTTVNDAGLNRDVIHMIDSLQRAGDLQIRVYAMVSSTEENLDYYLGKAPIKNELLNVSSFKVYADGALGSRGAILKLPYSDFDGHFGALVTPVEKIRELAERIADSDYQMNTHAIGDSANAIVLRAYAEVLPEQADRRWKVEHAQVVSPEEMKIFGQGIIPSVQPTHATSDMYWAEDRLGPERIGNAYAFKTLLDAAGILALGTDFPVEEVNPFYTFYAAVGRQDLQGVPADGYRMEEALSREEALRGMTIWAAWSNFEEAEKGSIEAGKLADFVILSGDIMQLPLVEIPELQAEAVYLGGKKVK